MTLQQTVARLRESMNIDEQIKLLQGLLACAGNGNYDVVVPYRDAQKILHALYALETREPPAMVVTDELVEIAWKASNAAACDGDPSPTIEWQHKVEKARIRAALTAALTKEQK